MATRRRTAPNSRCCALGCAPRGRRRQPRRGGGARAAPLIVREPLERVPRRAGPRLRRRSRPSASARATRTSPTSSGAATSASCCAARRGRRCRRPPTTCCARRACSPPSRAPPVRAPTVLAACDDESVLGVPFYVMEYVEGTVITSEIPEALDTPEERRRIGEELVDALVEIHAVDWRRAGSRASASRPATSSASCAASTACGSTTRRASCRWCRRSPSGWRPTCPSPPRRRSCTATTGSGNTMVANERARAAGRDLRLGAVHDRRPAGRRRLPDRDVGRARRPRRTCCSRRSPRPRGARASPPARS